MSAIASIVDAANARDVYGPPPPAPQIRLLGDPILSAPCDPITDVVAAIDLDSALRRAIAAHHEPSLGLSANQIGVTLRMFIARVGGKLETFANPKVLGRSSDVRRFLYEGCLSIPGFRTNTVRPRWVDLAWSDGKLSALSCRRFYDIEAQIVQHELDHLDGKLIVDGLSRQQRRQAERLVAKYRESVS